MDNEKRLIDANVLKELIYRRSNNLRDGWTAPAVILAVNAQPTVDAVEVVRCKDCEYGIDEEHNGLYSCHASPWGMGGYNKADDFCSYGERKDNERKTDGIG